MSNPRVIAIGPGMIGPRGPSDNVSLPFSWGDASPSKVITTGVNKIVYGVEIVILTAFDGSGAALSVGDTTDHSRLMSTAQNAPGTVATYQAAPGYKYTSATDINLYITPGAGASAGNGLVILYLEQ